jgi:uncharacterized membrane protein YkvA (DUF1232 family)
VIDTWKSKARALKRETRALYLASRDPRVPWYARALAIGLVAYALSPIDLIPDFIPVLGYLDDLVIIPAGIYVLIRLIPKGVMAECREKAACENWSLGRQAKIGAAVIIVVWLAVVVVVTILVLRAVGVL